MVRRVFLTGASAGIGLATARALSAAGCEVWGTSRSAERLPATLLNFHPVALDLDVEDSVRDGFQSALEAAGGRFDVLINNAGGGWFGPGAEMPSEALKSQFDALLFGPIALMKMALPSLRSQPGGLVINVTSLAARLPLPFGAAYSASKAALSVYTAGLQMEETAEMPEGRHRVRFVDVQPGDINTGFNRAMSFWSKKDDPVDAVAAALRRSLKASDESLAGAPPPERVARVIRGLVASEGELPLQVTVGNAWQALGGSLAYRFLPRGMLLWTIRKNCGL